MLDDNPSAADTAITVGHHKERGRATITVPRSGRRPDLAVTAGGKLADSQKAALYSFLARQ